MVCTFDTSKSFRLCQIDTDHRTKISVFYYSKQKPILVNTDTLINTDFACFSRWNTLITMGAFFAGLFAGIALMAVVAAGATLLVTAAVIIVSALSGAALGAFFTNLFTVPCKCNQILRTINWTNPHPTVKIDTHEAITKLSLINCPEGGTLLPFIEEAKAKQAASLVGKNNRISIGVAGVASLIGGSLLGATAYTNPLQAVVLFVVGIATNELLVSKIIGSQTAYIRKESEEGGGIIYENMNFNFEDDIVESNSTADITTIIGYDIVSPSMDINEIDNLYKSRNEILEQKKVFDNAAENPKTKGKGANSSKNNRNLSKLMENPRYEDIYTNAQGKKTGKNAPVNHKKASARAQEKAKATSRNIKTQFSKLSLNIALLAAPFGAHYFNEKARDKAAGLACQDLNNHIGIMAQEH